jgi:hypothetical protein
VKGANPRPPSGFVRLAVNVRHIEIGIAGAGDFLRQAKSIDPGKIVLAERHLERSDIFFQIRPRKALIAYRKSPRDPGRRIFPSASC